MENIAEVLRVVAEGALGGWVDTTPLVRMFAEQYGVHGSSEMVLYNVTPIWPHLHSHTKLLTLVAGRSDLEDLFQWRRGRYELDCGVDPVDGLLTSRVIRIMVGYRDEGPVRLQTYMEGRLP